MHARSPVPQPPAEESQRAGRSGLARVGAGTVSKGHSAVTGGADGGCECERQRVNR